jgi:hypothetical protein
MNKLIAERQEKTQASLYCLGLNNDLIHYINHARKILNFFMTDKLLLVIGGLPLVVKQAYAIEYLYVCQETNTAGIPKVVPDELLESFGTVDLTCNFCMFKPHSKTKPDDDEFIVTFKFYKVKTNE